MSQTLPHLQKRAVELLPELIALIKQHGTAPEAPDQHPASRLIQERFAAAGDRMMGAILRAYLNSFIKGSCAIGEEDPFKRDMQDILTGNLTILLPGHFKQQLKPHTHKPIPLVRGLYCMHKVTEDVLMKRYGEDAGKRLAASIASLSHPRLVPLKQITRLPLEYEEVVEEFKRQLECMKNDGVNPFVGKSIREIGGTPEVGQTPQAESFDYKNISADAKSASRKHPLYVSLKSPAEDQYDYVITANVICPAALKEVHSRDALFDNGDLFCACANRTKNGGMIIHDNQYESINSPPLYDADLHALAGVEMIDPPSSGSIDASPADKARIYIKTSDKQVSEDEYAAWAHEHGALASWVEQFALRRQLRYSTMRY